MRASHADKFITALVVATCFLLCCPPTRGDEPLKPIAAFAQDSRILFQGDSITDGKRGRSADPNHILGHGYVFIIVAKLAEKHHAALVHFQQAFDDAVKRAPAEHWIWDGVHPTYNGHQIMADEWVRAVGRFWPD